MQNRYVGDIGDYLKLGILRALSPGHLLGVAWWLHSDEDHNKDGRHVGYLQRPEQWRHFDPDLFDALANIVAANQRDVQALEGTNILPGAIFASEVIPSSGPVTQRRAARQEWFTRTVQKLAGADLVFVDPDNGLEPDGYSHASAKAGKSVLLSELRELARPGRCLIVYHHHTRRKGGHHAEIEYWADRLQDSGFATVDALRAKPYSPRVYFLLNAPPDVRRRAGRLQDHWQGWITWHPDRVAREAAPNGPTASMSIGNSSQVWSTIIGPSTPSSITAPKRSDRRRTSITTQVGYVNRNQQEVIRQTGKPRTDHGQYIYVLRCKACGHEYGANGSDIWLRRCPAHDKGASELAF